MSDHLIFTSTKCDFRDLGQGFIAFHHASLRPLSSHDLEIFEFLESISRRRGERREEARKVFVTYSLSAVITDMIGGIHLTLRLYLPGAPVSPARYKTRRPFTDRSPFSVDGVYSESRNQQPSREDRREGQKHPRGEREAW